MVWSSRRPLRLIQVNGNEKKQNTHTHPLGYYSTKPFSTLTYALFVAFHWRAFITEALPLTRPELITFSKRNSNKSQNFQSFNRNASIETMKFKFKCNLLFNFNCEKVDFNCIEFRSHRYHYGYNNDESTSNINNGRSLFFIG